MMMMMMMMLIITINFEILNRILSESLNFFLTDLNVFILIVDVTLLMDVPSFGSLSNS